MNQKPHQRRGLGRGLGALIPTAPRDDDHRDGAATAVLTAPVPTSPDWIGVALPGDHVDGTGDATADAAAGEAAGDGAGDDPTSHGGDQPAVQADQTDEQTAHQAAEQTAEQTAGPAPGQPSAQASEPAPARSEHTGHTDEGGDQGLRSVDGAWFAELPVDEIRPNPRQPREVFGEEAMAELVASITEVGLLQPVVVRPVDDGYELVMGERRWRATRQAGLTTIPAIVRRTSDDDLLRDALLENLHRAELNALEEAAAYQQLLEDFGCTHEELAGRIGRSRPQISNTIRLLKLSPAVQRRVAAGVLSAGHARTLLGVEDATAQDRLASRVVAEGISVRGLEELVAVGDTGGRPRAVRRARPSAPGVEDLAARLSDRLETRVKVDLGQRKGRVTIEFASVTDLERIVAVIDPDHPTRTHRSVD